MVDEAEEGSRGHDGGRLEGVRWRWQWRRSSGGGGDGGGRLALFRSRVVRLGFHSRVDEDLRISSGGWRSDGVNRSSNMPFA